ncbi:hypothetical protein LCGC14_1927360 [marine sediment metagenome]|uniref:Uncharacterized protein n=1 Tax=marine sediment metagenome TaxID=412755 RepID=A0A0F9GCA3_9ZZZZ
MSSDEGNGGGRVSSGVPVHSHSGYVSSRLCLEARAHQDTKIDSMGKSIRMAIYLASTVLGGAIMIFQWYIAVNIR